MTHLEDIGRSPATLYNYRRYVDRELAPTIGALRVSKLTASHLDGLYSSLRRRGLAPATIRQIHAIVRAALNQAVRWGLVSRNVASLASAPSQPQREQQPPSVAEVVALIEAADALEPMFGLYEPGPFDSRRVTARAWRFPVSGWAGSSVVAGGGSRSWVVLGGGGDVVGCVGACAVSVMSCARRRPGQPGRATRSRWKAMTMSVVHGHDRWKRTIVWRPVWTMSAAACQTR